MVYVVSFLRCKCLLGRRWDINSSPCVETKSGVALRVAADRQTDRLSVSLPTNKQTDRQADGQRGVSGPSARREADGVPAVWAGHAGAGWGKRLEFLRWRTSWLGGSPEPVCCWPDTRWTPSRWLNVRKDECHWTQVHVQSEDITRTPVWLRVCSCWAAVSLWILSVVKETRGGKVSDQTGV